MMPAKDAATRAFDFSRAPFRLPDGADPARIAAEMESCFRIVDGLPRKMSACFAAVVASAGIDGHPLASAGGRVAADMDAGEGDGGINPYHNTRHFCEVLLSALCLSNLVPLATEEKAQLLFAALVHDFHHDGNGVDGVPFRLERLALAKTAPYLDAERVAPDIRAGVEALVLATFVPAGVPFARQCHRYHRQGGPQPVPPEGSGPLGLLASQPRLTMLAVLLSEADVLASVGLTAALADDAQAKIGKEMNLVLDASDKLFFLETVFGQFEVGTFFAPNLEALKQGARARRA